MKTTLVFHCSAKVFLFSYVDYFGASKIPSWGHHFDYLFIAHSEWRTWEKRMENVQCVFYTSVGLSFQDVVPDVLTRGIGCISENTHVK